MDKKIFAIFGFRGRRISGAGILVFNDQRNAAENGARRLR